MTARVTQVSGERLSEFLRQPRGALTRVEVTSPPPTWAPLKPALSRFVRWYRESGSEPPIFSGVPLCLFGSEWPGFPSTARTAPAHGRCADCQARQSCGFAAQVPDELLPISDAPLLQRWRDYTAAFRRATACDTATTCTSFVKEIVAAYRGPVSLEPSVLVSNEVDAAIRFVVFPHRTGTGAAAEAQYKDVLACVEQIQAELGSDRCVDLIDTLRQLPPAPIPVGMEGRDGSWRLKLYLRMEDRTPVERQAVLDALARFASPMQPVPAADVQMLGLVLDEAGLHTLKAYVSAQPTRRGAAGFPSPLAADHPLVILTGDRALATLDVWCRGARRSNKWDFNLRDHYLAGAAAERLVAEIASQQSATALRPLLIGPTYRADIVAVGVREETLALYLELN